MLNLNVEELRGIGGGSLYWHGRFTKNWEHWANVFGGGYSDTMVVIG